MLDNKSAVITTGIIGPDPTLNGSRVERIIGAGPNSHILTGSIESQTTTTGPCPCHPFRIRQIRPSPYHRGIVDGSHHHIDRVGGGGEGAGGAVGSWTQLAAGGAGGCIPGLEGEKPGAGAVVVRGGGVVVQAGAGIGQQQQGAGGGDRPHH